MDQNAVLTAFAALSQSTRLDVVRLLIQAGPEGLPAGDIAERLGVKQNTMSANLSVLSHAGLVSSQREGRSIRYFANYDGIRGVVIFLMRDCCGGQSDLCQPVLDTLSCC